MNTRRKIERRLDTEENRAWWAAAEDAARIVETWPAWKRAGINVAALRDEVHSPCTCGDGSAGSDSGVGCGAACGAH